MHSARVSSNIKSCGLLTSWREDTSTGRVHIYWFQINLKMYMLTFCRLSFSSYKTGCDTADGYTERSRNRRNHEQWLTLVLRLGMKRASTSVFCIIKKFRWPWGAGNPFMTFLNMEWAQNATIRSSIGESEIVRRDVQHTRIILKLAKFYACVD